MRRVIGALGIVTLALGLTGGSASAWQVQQSQVPADFITGGGWFIIECPYDVPDGSGGFTEICSSGSSGTRANFGWHGGVKNGDWWGNGNYIDHGPGLHVHSIQVTGYVCAGLNSDGTPATATPDAGGCSNDVPDEEDHMPAGTRDVCGIAAANDGNTYTYRVRMKDSTDHPFGDGFGISLFLNGSLVYFAWGNREDPTPGGGSVQLHKPNPSNVAPSTPPQCPDDFFTDRTTLDGRQP